MAASMDGRLVLLTCLLVAPLLLAGGVHGHPWGGLFPQFYDHSCPQAKEIVKSIVAQAVARETRMAASLVRLHFHDCFVQGCDASILLDNSTGIVSEKGSNPNRNSARGFEVIDEIKVTLEHACPGTVSCADILALAARDSTLLVGGPYWDVPLGRRDSLGASIQGSNNDIPAPNNTLPTIVTKFRRQGLDVADVVVLSGAHTIGVSHCSSFAGVPDNPADRLYNFSSPDKIDPALSKAYAFLLKSICPSNSSQFFPTTTTLMDLITPDKLDNKYYVGLTNNLGLFMSDAALLTNATMKALVDSFVRSEATWKAKFARSMLKMGQIGVLTGTQGEIRRNCRVVNPAPRTAAGVHRVVAGSDSSGFTGVAFQRFKCELTINQHGNSA